MTESTERRPDPLEVFGEGTARPEADTTSRMKERLHVYVAQDRARQRRRRRRVLLGLAGVLAAVAFATLALSLL